MAAPYMNVPEPTLRAQLRSLDAATPLTVTAYGATGDGATDDTDALQACLDAVPAEGATVYFPAGTYLAPAGGLVCDNPVRLCGDPGLDGTGSRILVTGDHVTGLTLNAGASIVENLTVSHPTGGTRSTDLVGLVVNNANFSRLHGVKIDGFSKNALVTNGVYYSVLNCSFRDFVTVGLELVNPLAGGDAADSTVQNCTFDRGSDTATGGTAVLWESGGGLRFTNNKINGRPTHKFEHGVRFTPAADIATGVLMVEGNSIENFTGIGVSLVNNPDGGVYNSVIVAGNEIAAHEQTASTGLFLDDDVSGTVITGNHFYSLTNGIDLQRVKHAVVSGNSLSNIETLGVRIRYLVRDVVIGRQPIDVETGGVDIQMDDAAGVADPSYEKMIPFGGSGNSGMSAITDGDIHDLLEVAVNPYSTVIVDIDITAVSQGAGTWVFRGARMIAGNAPGADLTPVTIGTDYIYQGTVAQMNLTVSGLGGVFRLGVQKIAGTDLSGHMRVKVRGSGMTTFKQLQRYN